MLSSSSGEPLSRLAASMSAIRESCIERLLPSNSGPITQREKFERRNTRLALPLLVIVLPGLSDRMQSSTVRVVPASLRMGPVLVWPPAGEWPARLMWQNCSEPGVALLKLISPQRFAGLAQVMETGLPWVPGTESAPFTMRSAPPLPPLPKAVPFIRTWVPGEMVRTAPGGTVTSSVTLMTPLHVSLPARVPVLVVMAGMRPRLVMALVAVRPSTVPEMVKFPGSTGPPLMGTAVISQFKRWSVLRALLWTSTAIVLSPLTSLVTGRFISSHAVSWALAMAPVELVDHESFSSNPSAARNVPLR